MRSTATGAPISAKKESDAQPHGGDEGQTADIAVHSLILRRGHISIPELRPIYLWALFGGHVFRCPGSRIEAGGSILAPNDERRRGRWRKTAMERSGDCDIRPRYPLDARSSRIPLRPFSLCFHCW